MKMLAFQGSPRKGGNSDILLNEAIRGAEEAGAEVEKIELVDLDISPCLELYACKKAGNCAIKDDMQALYTAMEKTPRIILASPIFFYNVSATAKAFIDRCQAKWVKRYMLGIETVSDVERKGALIAVGATKGKKLFDGVRLTAKYFFDAIHMSYSDELLVRGADDKGDILKQPEALEEAFALGKRLAAP